jgi:DNA-binding NtrC family response regulator
VRELRNTIERAVLLADGTMLDAPDVAEESAPSAPSSGDGDLPFPATIAAITQAAARRMLELCNGNKSVTARRLGISRPRLQRLLDATLDQLERDDEATDE